MDGYSLKVEQELIGIALRTQPRGLLNGVVFAVITLSLVWAGLPHAFLLVWITAFATLAVARFRISRAFAAAPQPVPHPREWARRAAFGYGATGFAWGTLGGACLLFAPHVQLYVLWVVFLVALFAVLSAQTTACVPVVFKSFVLSAMWPIFGVCVLTDAPHYWMRLFALMMFFAMSLMVGRTGNRYVADSIRMRFENLDLLRDLGEQKDAVDRANLAKTRFLAAASHDLRQPMQALVLLVESLQDRVKDPTNRHIAESIHSTVESMSMLLNEILDLSRLEAGTVSPQRSSFPIATVLDRLRAAYTYPAARKDLALRVHDSECIVSTDPILLYRILVNL